MALSLTHYDRWKTQVGQHHHPWGMSEENRPIFLVRGLRTPLREAWPRLKHWN